MNWFVATQSHSEPADVAEVRTFVVVAESEAEAYGKLREAQKGQMVRGIVGLNDMGWLRKIWESEK